MYVYHLSLLKERKEKSLQSAQAVLSPLSTSGKEWCPLPETAHVCPESGKACAIEPSCFWNTTCTPGDDQALFCFGLSDFFLTLLLTIT